MKISAIVAMSQNRVIGRENQIPWHLPEDLRRFKKITMGCPVIMGRKTYESIGRLLPGRVNCIITRQKGLEISGAVVVGSWQEAKEYFSQTTQEVFVIGGSEIYRMAWLDVQTFYLTLIHQEFAGDVFFPEFSWSEFQEVAREDVSLPIPHSYLVLKRVKSSPISPHAPSHASSSE